MATEFNSPQLPPIGWVSSLEEEDRELLSSYGEFLGLQSGKDLIVQGQHQVHLYLLISGTLEVRRDGLDQDVIIGSISSGESIGEMSVFDPGPASATVRAVEFSQIWSIDADSLGEYLVAHPAAGSRLMVGLATILSRRLRHANHKLVERNIS